MRPKLTILAACLLALPAYAHGEEVLETFYWQAAAVLALLVGLRLYSNSRPYWRAGYFGCLAGVVLSWLATAQLPYMQHRHLITAIDVVLPVVLATLSVLVAQRRVWRKSHRSR